MLDRAPITLNPRHAGDAISQRLNALLFRGLTRIDEKLEPRPDLASGWQILDGGRTWKFFLRAGERDHGGEPITPERMARCLENYRAGKPASIYRAAFRGWLGTEVDGDAVRLRLDHTDPYLARNVSLLRYFRAEGDPAREPCADPAPGKALVTSGLFRPRAPWDPAPENELALTPFAPGRGDVTFLFVPDDNARALKLLRGEADTAPNSLSLTKLRWLQREHPGRFEVLEPGGVMVSYLAFNLRDPLLARKEVRQAIALSIDRASIARHKLLGFARPAGSFLSPSLPEALASDFPFEPARAEALLDAAGLRRPRAGAPRFELRYRSTPKRENVETGLMLQDMLGRVGIRLLIDTVEPAVFLASTKKGAFQLYSSSWVGIADASILHRTLRSEQPDNRVGYRNPEMDRILDAAARETSLPKRLPLVRRAQALMAEDVPYLPLWHWNNAVIHRKGLQGLRPEDLSLSGAYEPITRLR